MSKLSIFYDDVIFRLQRKGGISYIFSELISCEKYNDIFEKKLLVTSKSKNTNIYFDSLRIQRLFYFISIPKIILQFLPLFVIVKEKCLIHLSYYNLVFGSRNIIKVITIHDFGYEYKLMQSGIRRKVNIFFKYLAIKQADAIICVSKNTRDDLFKFYGNLLHNKPVNVIYNGVDELFFKKVSLVRIIDSHYILFVGNRARYKQFDLAINLINLVSDRILVIVGGSSLSKREIDKLKSISGRYIIDINVDVERLRNYYSHAECLIYPSIYEGFGLPVIEANACGCPVLAGKHSSIIEISNGYNYLVKNNEVSYYYDEYLKIRKTFTNEMREALISNAMKFKGEVFREMTYEYYLTLLKEKK
jgi:glycosyltransferase involved in cell wall biosynthesis